MDQARKPIVSVTGPMGGNLVARFGSSLAGLTITDADGAESDTCEIRIRVSLPFPKGPAKNTRYEVRAAWSDGGAALTGTYLVQRHSFTGDAESGYEMVVSCRAGDLQDKLKGEGLEHFDEMTLGDIARRIGSDAGYDVVVDPELGSIHIPYRLRHNQSRIDFLSTLAGDFGGTAKVAGNKLILKTKGKGKSASGAALSPIRISAEECTDISLDFETRGDVKDSEVCVFDPAKGRLEVLSAGRDGFGKMRSVIEAPSKGEATKMAKARAEASARKSCEGSLTVAGRPGAKAGADVILSGFGPDADGASLSAATVTHEISPDGGWFTTIDLEKKTG